MNKEIEEQLQEIKGVLEAAEIIHDIQNELIEEKKTREEYIKRKFLKNHNYDKETGTIDVGDGRRTKIRMNTDNIAYKSELSPNSDGDDGVIKLNRNFFKLKNAKRREAALQHEVGHGTMHLTGSNLGNRSMVTSNILNDIIKDYDHSNHNFKDLKKDLHEKYNKRYDEFTRKYFSYEEFERAVLIGVLNKHGCNNYDINKMSNDDLYALLRKLELKMSTKVSKDEGIKNAKENPERDKMYNYAKKYVGTDNPDHESPQEIEADRYAANRIIDGSKVMKKTIREIDKFDRKDIHKKDGSDKVHEHNKKFNPEMVRRNKALDDMTLRKSKLYK